MDDTAQGKYTEMGNMTKERVRSPSQTNEALDATGLVVEAKPVLGMFRWPWQKVTVTVDGRKKKQKLLRRNYWDKRGVLRFEMVRHMHNPQDELQAVANLDSDVIRAGTRIYVVDIKWLMSWIDFAVYGCGTPGKITNHKLVGRKTGKVKKAAQYNKHWRPVSEQTFKYLHTMYGGQPVIWFDGPSLEDLYIPPPQEEVKPKEEDKKELKKLDISDDEGEEETKGEPKDEDAGEPEEEVDHSVLQGHDPVTTYMSLLKLNKICTVEWPELDMAEGVDDITDLHFTTLQTLQAEKTAAVFASREGEKEFAKAKQMQAQIDEAQMGTVKGLFASAEGANMMKEAKELEKAADAAAEDADKQVLLEMMKSGEAERAMKEAAELKAKQGEANAAAAAGMMTGMMGDAAMADAKKAEEEAQAAAAQAMFGGQASGMADAIKSGDEQAKQQAGARMLQGAWRKKQARRAMAEKKRQRDELRQRGSAMMLQGAWRKKQARKKAAEMKAAREAKMQQGAALKLQSAYRIRRARKKAAEMKARAEAVRMQGASLMLQGAWRRKQARKKVAALKAEKQRILEHGAAVLVQSVWRAKQAKKLVGEAREELAKNNAMSNVLQGRMRQHLAKNKTKHAFRKWTRPFLIKLVCAKDLKKADALGSSDPFVVVTALEPEAPEDHTVAAKNLTQEAAEAATTDELGEQKMRYISSCIKNSLNPEWNEEVLITGVNGFSNLVFTVLDKDLMQLGDYDFLGQCVKSIAHEDLWHSGEPFQVELPLGDMKHTVINDKGSPMGIAQGTGQGTITIEFIPQNSHGVIAGWGDRYCQNKSLLGGAKSSWERKWIALTHRGGLKCWDNLNNMNDEDKHVKPVEVSSVEILTDHEGKESVLEIGRTNDPKPILLSIDGQGKVLQWKSKLERMMKIANEDQAAADGGSDAAAEPEKRSTSTGLMGTSPFKGMGWGKK